MDDSARTPQKPGDAGRFRIANGPLVQREEHEQNAVPSDLAQLPRTYGTPIFFAVPRDPRTVFTYWNMNWHNIFADAEPFDKNVYLRLLKATGEVESESPVEPMLGTHYTAVSTPRANYRAELGYYQPAAAWRSVAISDAVAMPPEDPSENLDVDVATIPFHLSFQRMIDLFRASNGGSVTALLSRLQGRALSDDERQLFTPEEWEILRAMNLSLSKVAAARRAFSDGTDADRLRKRAEAILGFGGTSPAGGFGGSSWGSSPS
jgi:hypothetical protein